MRIIRFSLAILGSFLIAPAAIAAYTLLPFQSMPVGSASKAVAIGDVNGDGRDDAILATGFRFDAVNDYSVFVFLQQKDGTLADPLRFPYLSQIISDAGLAVADLDGVKGSEIVVGHNAGVTILRWSRGRIQAGMRSTLYDVSRQVEHVAIADVDRDGHPDIVGLGSDGSTVFFNDGRGGIVRTAQMATPPSSRADMKSADLDADGHLDIVMQPGDPSNDIALVYLNDGSDDLAPPFSLDPGDFSVNFGVVATPDFDDDGLTDLVVGRSHGELATFRQSTPGNLVPDTPITSFDAAAMQSADIDGDGRDDLAARTGNNGVLIYLQDDSGLVFAGSYGGPQGSTAVNSNGLALGDLNGDACTDVAVFDANSGLAVFPGSDCLPAKDVATNVGLTRSNVALRIDNFGPGQADAIATTLTLSVLQGALQLGTLPAGCTAVAQNLRIATLECTIGTLAAGTHRMLPIPISVSGGDRRNRLHSVAESSVAGRDLHPANNRAVDSLWLAISP